MLPSSSLLVLLKKTELTRSHPAIIYGAVGGRGEGTPRRGCEKGWPRPSPAGIMPRVVECNVCGDFVCRRRKGPMWTCGAQAWFEEDYVECCEKRAKQACRPSLSLYARNRKRKALEGIPACRCVVARGDVVRCGAVRRGLLCFCFGVDILAQRSCLFLFSVLAMAHMVSARKTPTRRQTSIHFPPRPTVNIIGLPDPRELTPRRRAVARWRLRL